MPNPLPTIRNKAKLIRKKNPRITWKSALKKAGKEYREGSIGKKHRKWGPVKKHKRRVSAVNIPAKKHTDYNQPEVNISIGTLKSRLKNQLTDQLSDMLVRKELMSSKGNKLKKRKLQKQITAKKSEIKRIS